MAPPKWRGRLNTIVQLGTISGIVVANAINIGTNRLLWGWRLSLGLAAVPGSILLLGKQVTCTYPAASCTMCLHNTALSGAKADSLLLFNCRCAVSMHNSCPLQHHCCAISMLPYCRALSQPCIVPCSCTLPPMSQPCCQCCRWTLLARDP